MKGQSFKWSVVEQITATALKFVWAMVIWQILAVFLLGIKMPLEDNFYITSIFAINSVLVGILFRRLFNWIHIKYHA